MDFTQKETSLLKDMKDQEQVCIEKYNHYSDRACDTQLKNLFSQLGQNERQHYDTLNQISGGTVPSVNSGQSGQSGQTFTATYSASASDPNKQKDCFLCTDALSTEKHVSSVYNTAIFEFRDANIRNTLNHIQKEEQEHGEKIYNYMAQNGMYNA